MLMETKKELKLIAGQLIKPYEEYSINELADGYCLAVDTDNGPLKDMYISALLLRFWYTIDRMYRNNTVVSHLEHEDFFNWLYEAIEYACKYRGWRDESKNLNAQQCINQCINTIKLQKYYTMRLDKHKSNNFCVSLDTPAFNDEEDNRTLADMLESDERVDDHSEDTAISLVQDFINQNKIIEAILIDNIAFNDVQKHTKRTIKTTNYDGEKIRYTEYSSEFWPYRLVQIVSKLPDTYKTDFLSRYTISEDKLETILEVIDRANNRKLYKYLRLALADLRRDFVF